MVSPIMKTYLDEEESAEALHDCVLHRFLGIIRKCSDSGIQGLFLRGVAAANHSSIENVGRNSGKVSVECAWFCRDGVYKRVAGMGHWDTSKGGSLVVGRFSRGIGGFKAHAVIVLRGVPGEGDGAGLVYTELSG